MILITFIANIILTVEKPNSMKVSKVYFEKYIFDTMSDYITDNRFLSAEWYIV